MADLQTFSARPVGIAPDVSPANSPLDVYNSGVNVVFEEDKARRQAGYVYRRPQAVTPPEALQYRNIAGVDSWLYAGSKGIGLDQLTQIDITPAGYVTDATPGLFGWTTLNDVPVFNHPEMVPYYHDGLLFMLPIPGWPAGWYCNRMVAFKFFLMALGGGEGLSEINDQIRWSSSADPGLLPAEWIPSPTNDAGDLVIGEPEGAILDAVPLKDTLIVYKASSTHLVQYIGSRAFPFAQRTLYPNTGILAAKCACEYKGRHFVVTQGDVIVHDGSRAQSIVDGQARRAIFDDINGSLANRAFAYIDPQDLSFCFCYPSRDAVNYCNRRARYSLGGGPDAGRWTFEVLAPDEVADVGVGRYIRSSIGGDWDSAATTWDDTLGRWDDAADQGVGDQTLEALHDAVELAEPTLGGERASLVPVSELQWSTKQLNPGRVFLVDHVWPILENPSKAPIKMQFGVQEDFDAPIDWGPEVDVVEGRGVDVAMRGKFFSVRLRAQVLQDFSIAGFDIDWRDAGRW